MHSIQSWLQSLGPNADLALRCAFNTLLGGLLGFYVRELYKRFGTAVGDRESFGNLFPVLTAITVVVIFVVKSSLALSLGLVGALSIVRFRTAIKSPEELVYLFFCIGFGVALGAELRLLALLSAVIISLFIAGRRYLPLGLSPKRNLVVTVSGEAETFFQEPSAGVLSLLEEVAKDVDVQRLDLEDGRVQLRASLAVARPEDAPLLLARLRERYPDFDASYVNLDSLM